MRIKDVLVSAGLTGFYFDDQRAIKRGALHDGFAYLGDPVTPGFTSIRQAGESISVMLVLEDGQIAYGDCAAVQYSGAGGRDPLFLAAEYMPIIEYELKPIFVGTELDSFRSLAENIDSFRRTDGKRLHTATRYGVTQALLDAVAKSKHVTMTEVIALEYGLDIIPEPVPIFAQTGDSRYENADKAIIKRVDVLPHALINNVEEKLGKHGEKLLDYVGWLRNRVLKLRTNEEYSPVFHIDVYGTIGLAFDFDQEKIVKYLSALQQAADPFRLRIEGPVDMEDHHQQIAYLAELTRRVDDAGVKVEIVADEWCNTLEDIKEFADAGAGHMAQIKTPDLGGIQNIIEAVLYCKKKGIGAYVGGSCNETDRSAQICVHIALASRPDQMLAKPGMGVDEGLAVVRNEMNRTIALLRAKLSEARVGGEMHADYSS